MSGTTSDSCLQPRLVGAKQATELPAASGGITQWRSSLCGRPCIIRHWVENTYSSSVLGRKLKGSPVQQEVRGALRARKLGVCTPVPFLCELETNSVYLEDVGGRSLLDALKDEAAESEKFMGAVARTLALVHDGGFIHGSLESSKMLIAAGSDEQEEPAMVLAGWSNSFNSTSPEDKALDLYHMEQSFLRDHPDRPELFEQVMAVYKRKSKQWSAVHNKLADVRKKAGQKGFTTRGEDGEPPSKVQKVD